MRINLENFQADPTKKPKLIVIGTLTPNQLKDINQHLVLQGRACVTEEVVFRGIHIYKSRVERDGYTIEDVLDQIESALAEGSGVLKNPQLTILANPHSRLDRHGNKVTDQAVFECTDHHPRVQLYSVIPKGDKNKPKKEKAT